MLTPSAKLMSEREAPKHSVFIFVDAPIPLRIWTGFESIMTTADDDLDPSQIYIGAGLLTSLDPLSQLIGGIAERISIGLVGTDPQIRAYIDDEDSGLEGSRAYVGIAFFDDNWKAERVGWVWPGKADVIKSSYRDGVRRIGLSLGSEFVDRARAYLLYWTNAGHQKDHPGDLFCERVPIYSQVYSPVWPAP
jgi:hypothetical protein